MVEERVYEGKDLDEAIHSAASALGIHEDDLHYEIVEQGRRGVFGLGARSVQIRVMPPLEQIDQEAQPRVDGRPQKAVAARGADRSSGKPAPKQASRTGRPRRGGRNRGRRPESTGSSPRPSSAPADPTDPADAEKVVETLQRITELMGLELESELTDIDSGVTISLSGPDTPTLLDQNAQLLSAIQFLLNRMSRRAWPGARRIQLECEGRGGNRGRDDELVTLVREVAQQVAQTGRMKRLQPMNSYERRLAHLTVREYGGLSSSSEGNGALKRVRISKVRNSIE